MNDTAALRQAVRLVLREAVTLAKPPEELEDNGDLYALGLSSFDLISLLVALESRFGIEFPKEMMERGTFASVDAIAAAVQILTQRTLTHVT